MRPKRFRNRNTLLPLRIYVEVALIGACILASAIFATHVLLANTGDALSQDLTSYLAPAVALVDGSMPLYETYFDIKPPGIMLAFVPWIYVFGWQLRSMMCLELLILLSIFLSMWNILRLACSRVISSIIYFFIVSVLLSSSVFSGMLLSPEFIGIALVLGAVKFLGSGGRGGFLISGFLFAWASQTKEVFAVPALLIFLMLFVRAVKPSARRAFIEFTLGALIGLGTIACAVFVSGSGRGYFRSLQRKSDLFPAPNAADFLSGFYSNIYSIFIRHVATDSWFFGSTLVAVTLFLVGSLALLGFLTAAKPRYSRYGVKVPAISFVVAFGLLIGFIWQQKPDTGHYADVTVFVFVFIVICVAASGIPTQVARERALFYGPLRVLTVLALGVFAVPVLFGSTSMYLSGARAMTAVPTVFNGEPTSTLAYFSTIGGVSDEGCIQVAYGWNPGAVYLYTGRLPCSSNFLANLVASDSDAQVQLRRDLVSRPPRVIIYDVNGADMDTGAYEATIFPYSAVIDQCYLPTEIGSVFRARSTSDKMSRCIRSELARADLR